MSRSDAAPDVVAPPPLLFLLALAGGFALDWALPTAVLGVLPVPARLALAGPALAGAGVLGVGGILAFRRAGTAVEPWHPADALVTTGIYARLRNPMYLGLLLILAAVALAAAAGGVLLATVGLAVALHYGVVKREERYLIQRFGAPYRRYLAAVPRWGLRISRARDDH